MTPYTMKDFVQNTKKPRRTVMFYGAFGEWSGPGSNRRHLHFQCSALPTELPNLRAVKNCAVRNLNGCDYGKTVLATIVTSSHEFSGLRMLERDRADCQSVHAESTIIGYHSEVVTGTNRERIPVTLNGFLVLEMDVR